jgi:hypothetical protein
VLSLLSGKHSCVVLEENFSAIIINIARNETEQNKQQSRTSKRVDRRREKEEKRRTRKREFKRRTEEDGNGSSGGRKLEMEAVEVGRWNRKK